MATRSYPEADIDNMGNFVEIAENPAGDSQSRDPIGDGELISRVRKGDQSAFEALFRRHHGAAVYVARTQSDNFSDAEDVVAEAFTSIFQSLAAGKGPETFFRAYLLTTVRRIAHAGNKAASRVQTTGDDSVLDESTFDDDPAIKKFEATTMAQAFRSLPERWQTVLWHIDVERMKPAAVAEIIGIGPNAVSSLVLRAREGLRGAYLQNHVLASTGTECEATVGQLGAFIRGGLRRSSAARVQDHLATCAKCTAVLAELDDVQSRMRIVLFPLITGIAFSPGACASIANATAAPSLPQPGGLAVQRILAGTAGALGIAAVFTLVSALAQGATGLKSDEAASVVSVPSHPIPASLPPSMLASAQPDKAQSEPTESTESTESREDMVPPSFGDLPILPVPEPVTIGIPFLRPGPSVAVTFPAPPVTFLAPPVTFPAPPVTTIDPPTPEVPQEGTPNEVSADFSFVPVKHGGSSVLTVGLTLHGEAALSNAYVVFSLPHGIRLGEDSVYPPGWECKPSLEDSRLDCSTSSLRRDELLFDLRVLVNDVTIPRTLDFEVGGDNIVSATFSQSFG